MDKKRVKRSGRVYLVNLTPSSLARSSKWSKCCSSLYPETPYLTREPPSHFGPAPYLTICSFTSSTDKWQAARRTSNDSKERGRLACRWSDNTLVSPNKVAIQPRHEWTGVLESLGRSTKPFGEGGMKLWRGFLSYSAAYATSNLPQYCCH